MQNDISSDKLAQIALRAFDECEMMNAPHVRDGILSAAESRNFSMQSAIQAIDDIRAGNAATIYVDENDPRWEKS